MIVVFLDVFHLTKHIFKQKELNEKNKENFKIVPLGGARTLYLQTTGLQPIPDRPRRHQLLEATTALIFIVLTKAVTRHTAKTGENGNFKL